MGPIKNSQAGLSNSLESKSFSIQGIDVLADPDGGVPGAGLRPFFDQFIQNNTIY